MLLRNYKTPVTCFKQNLKIILNTTKSSQACYQTDQTTTHTNSRWKRNIGMYEGMNTLQSTRLVLPSHYCERRAIEDMERKKSVVTNQCTRASEHLCSASVARFVDSEAALILASSCHYLPSIFPVYHFLIYTQLSSIDFLPFRKKSEHDVHRFINNLLS